MDVIHLCLFKIENSWDGPLQKHVMIQIIYTSPSCGPCHILKPQLFRVLDEANGKAIGVEIDIENEQEIAQQAEVNGTPTVHLFKEKELKKQWKGVKTRSEYKNALDLLIN